MISAAAQSLLSEASALRQSGRTTEAIAAYQRLLNIEPRLPDSWYNLGWLQRQARQFEPALTSYAQALALGVREPEQVHLNRAAILSDHLLRPDEAQAELERALAARPDYLPALLNLGNLAEDQGDRAAAVDVYCRAVAANPRSGLALARLAGVASDDQLDDMLGRIGKMLANPALDQEGRIDLCFAQGRLLDRAGRYREAFGAFDAANRASRAALRPPFAAYDPADHERLVDRLIATFSQRPAGGPDNGDAPLFICGMFRSGSTLIEQMLAAHSGVTPGGELDLLPAIVERLNPYPEAAASPDVVAHARAEYLAGAAAVRRGRLLTDKRPDNFLHIGLIKAMFPNARIVHTRRNPLDNILSLYFLQLHPGMSYAMDLQDAAHWYGQYQRLIAHFERLYGDDIFTVDYDDLVREPRSSATALMKFCGLDWEEDCLAPHLVKGAIKTASVWQVREPLHQRSSGRWRNYAEELQALAGRFDGDRPTDA